MRILTLVTKVKECLLTSLEVSSRRDVQKSSSEVQLKLGSGLCFRGFKNSLGQAGLS